MDLVNLLEQVIPKALSAGKLLAAEWDRPDGPRGTGDKAEVDVEIEEALRKDLLALLSCDFWGEETGSRLTGTEFCWVVDPNDGTSDFLNGHRGSAISIGLLRNAVPVLGVVYAPVTDDRGPDCISWAKGLGGVQRNGQTLHDRLDRLDLGPGTKVLVSTAAAIKPGLNAELCAPAEFIPMPSIAYRLARVAAGDAVAGISLVPVSAHDVVGGHAVLIGAKGVLLDQHGDPVSYESETRLSKTSQRCFGGAARACQKLSQRNWDKLFIS
ncbi:TPA: inositol monophosphatase [Pseudomonas aeruginosa]|uniref:inositol monophosphatase family protein n=1 Tax=Pseudomonas TaxID=286 RepID=UPI00093E17E5|nr:MULTISPECIES: inositol monophosphatase family protein [Pseudomonas]EKX2958314.1 inositol monophosphatase [Pseudomonas aeruginosa]MBG4113940.1 inositol monophosphatase [Pseudomonas aeruginosa]MBI6936930.1 inositol monophosphatase [Pseudomonas aeruginosa]MBI8014283.1 inositol monophosphatase [Pseudomonas aeruginosa]MBV6241901.1 inositol monophosphatase [Pseudomonas aeruginosa]